MYEHDVAVDYFAETNTRWRRPQTRKRLLKVTSQFWKRIHTSTSETITQWHKIYKPGGVITISTPQLSPVIIASEEDSHSLRRWSTVTHGGCKDTKITVITTYRPCKPSSDQGPTTVNAQQWNILENIDQEGDNLREKMIFDLRTHIKQLIDNQHEVILFIGANERHIYCSGIDKLIKEPK